MEKHFIFIELLDVQEIVLKLYFGVLSVVFEPMQPDVDVVSDVTSVLHCFSMMTETDEWSGL